MFKFVRSPSVASGEFGEVFVQNQHAIKVKKITSKAAPRYGIISSGYHDSPGGSTDSIKSRYTASPSGGYSQVETVGKENDTFYDTYSDFDREKFILGKLKPICTGQYLCLQDQKIYGDEIEGTDYIVTEYLEGYEPLLNYLSKENVKHNTEFYKPVFFRLIDALEILHGSNIAHSDIHTTNIMVNKDRFIRYVDFGLSCYDGKDKNERYDTCLTGLRTFLAPELLQQNPPNMSREVARQADIWALGMTIYVSICIISDGTMGVMPPFMEEKEEKLSASIVTKWLEGAQATFLIIDDSFGIDLNCLLNVLPEERNLMASLGTKYYEFKQEEKRTGPR